MEVIMDYAGRDASLAFRGHPKIAFLALKDFEIGELPEKQRIYRRKGLLQDEIPEWYCRSKNPQHMQQKQKK